MKTLLALTRRNTKIFFKDKAMLFTSLITPGILLLLYATFLGNVYRDAFYSNFPEGFTVEAGLIDGFVGAQLMSSILAVSCVTVAFCSNMLLVQDRASGVIHDLTIAPVRPWVLSMSYFLATFTATFTVCLVALALCMGYVAVVGFYLTVTDVLLMLLDTVLLTLFGTAFSSVVSFFLYSQGQMQAVGTIVSAGYGFVCGAYMPISQFSEGLQRFILFLPGTYGTALMRRHSLQGVLAELHEAGVPNEVIDGIMENVDGNLRFFDHEVPEYAMFLVVGGAVVVLILLYVLLHVIKSHTREKSR